MKDFIQLLGNITGGPVSTIVGLVLFIGGGFSIWQLDQSKIMWNSVELGLFGVGIILLLKSDGWIKSLFKKKE